VPQVIGLRGVRGGSGEVHFRNGMGQLAVGVVREGVREVVYREWSVRARQRGREAQCSFTSEIL